MFLVATLAEWMCACELLVPSEPMPLTFVLLKYEEPYRKGLSI